MKCLVKEELLSTDLNITPGLGDFVFKSSHNSVRKETGENLCPGAVTLIREVDVYVFGKSVFANV